MYFAASIRLIIVYIELIAVCQHYNDDYHEYERVIGGAVDLDSFSNDCMVVDH
jgi:hypothetical protein